MFIVLLTFSDNKAQAGQFMDDHKQWIKRGFDEQVFLVAGSIQPQAGGAVVAHNTSLAEITIRVNADPFVEQNVVRAEIIEVTPAKVAQRLEFLLH